MDEMQELVARYRAAWAAPALKLHHTESRGHHFTLPAAMDPLPDGLVQVRVCACANGPAM